MSPEIPLDSSLRPASRIFPDDPPDEDPIEEPESPVTPAPILSSQENPDDPIEKLRAFARTVEDNVEIYSQPLKPHLPAIGRFLIVITFLEDSLRIVTQWSDQLWYLQRCVC